MNAEITFILAAIVVSWVMFVFNFVLGYYIGRAVEHNSQKADHKPTLVKHTKPFGSYLPFSLRSQYAVN